MAGTKGMRRSKPSITSPTMVQKWRDSVSVGMIRERLDKQALGILKKKNGQPHEMSRAEIAAARILLDRCIPTVSSMEISGPNQGPIEMIDRSAVAKLDVAALTQLASILNKIAPSVK
jgi:hypothetical protein